MKFLKKFQKFLNESLSRTGIEYVRFLPDGHYGTPEASTNETFVKPYTKKQLISAYKKAIYSSWALGDVEDSNPEEMFDQYQYYNIYNYVFLIPNDSVEAFINAEFDARGNADMMETSMGYCDDIFNELTQTNNFPVIGLQFGSYPRITIWDGKKKHEDIPVPNLKKLSSKMTNEEILINVMEFIALSGMDFFNFWSMAKKEFTGPYEELKRRNPTLPLDQLAQAGDWGF